MERVTKKYAEQQMARLAKELGKKVHYCHQGPTFLPGPGLAEPAQYGTKDAWVLDSSAANGWLTIYAYSEEGRGGLYHAIPGDGSHKAQGIWDICRFAIDMLQVARGVSVGCAKCGATDLPIIGHEPCPGA
jgi:hypothetical protein